MHGQLLGSSRHGTLAHVPMYEMDCAKKVLLPLHVAPVHEPGPAQPG
jgi:hypothetical protein